MYAPVASQGTVGEQGGEYETVHNVIHYYSYTISKPTNFNNYHLAAIPLYE